MKYSYIFFLTAAVPVMVCAPLQAAVKVSPKGHDSQSVWAGSYSFKFRIDPDSPATKIFFYGFYLPDGRVACNGFEVDRRNMQITVSCYSNYKHRRANTTLENVLATGDSEFKNRRLSNLMDKDGKPCEFAYNKVYTVKVSAKDRSHSVAVFDGDKKIATTTYDASMLYQGNCPKKLLSFMNQPFAVKNAAECPVLEEHPRKLEQFLALKAAEQKADDKPEQAPKTPKKESTAPAPVPAGDVNAKDAEGNTALMRAAMQKDYRQVKALLEQGASAKIANKKGVSPFSYAFDNKDAELMQLFLSASLGKK